MDRMLLINKHWLTHRVHSEAKSPEVFMTERIKLRLVLNYISIEDLWVWCHKGRALHFLDFIFEKIIQLGRVLSLTSQKSTDTPV